VNLYSIALFAHIVGAILVFVLLTIEGLGLRIGFDYAQLNRVLGPVSAVLILVPGLYMMAAQWGWAGWIVTGIATYALIAGVGAYTGISVMRGRINRRLAVVSWLVRIGMALAVAFVMTVKPSLVLSVMAVLAGVALGAAVGALTRREVAVA
jgi:phosphatidylserine synthase